MYALKKIFNQKHVVGKLRVPKASKTVTKTNNVIDSSQTYFFGKTYAIYDVFN